MSRIIFEKNKNLGALMTELRARLGYITSGGAASNNDQIIRSFLQEANDYCYEALEQPHYKRVAKIKMVKGERLYDYHNDDIDEEIDPGNIQRVWLGDGENRYALTHGIDEAIRTFHTDLGMPERWDSYDGQLEVWPPADSNDYTLVIEYEGGKRRFEQAADLPSAPPRLVFLYALAQAKAHYRQPDYQMAAAAFDRALKEERGNRIMDPHTSMFRRKRKGWFVERGADGMDRARFFE